MTTPRTDRRLRRPTTALALTLALTGGGLAACGSQDGAPEGAAGPSSGATTPVGPQSSPSPGAPSGAPAVQTVTCPAATVKVGTAAQLAAALQAARPGDVIGLADGTYAGHFTATTPATPQRPIWLCGGPGAILDGGGTDDGYTLHLDGASAWRVVGVSVRGGQKGVMVDRTRGAVLQGLTVSGTGDEAVHLRAGSTGNLLVGSTIRNTGHREAKFGEGVYVGSAVKNWCTISGCQPDRSDGNTVANNHISGTTAESVDIKEGTSGGHLVGNTFDASATTAADSAVDVKGNGWTLQGNVVTATPKDAFQVHEIRDGWGRGNRFTGNRVQAGAGEVVKLAGAPDNTVACDNTGPEGMKITKDGCH